MPNAFVGVYVPRVEHDVCVCPIGLEGGQAANELEVNFGSTDFFGGGRGTMWRVVG